MIARDGRVACGVDARGGYGMAKVYERLDDALGAFIGRQHMFFVGSAPSGDDGHVNLSPKGLDTFRILDPLTVAYLDFTGSGIETLAHLRQNGRITMMFCALEGPPKILRLYGKGTVLEPDHPEFATLRGRFPEYPGVRAVVRVAVERIADACGFGVPRYRHEGERMQLLDWATHQGPERLEAYRREHSRSIDGLTGSGQGAE